MPYRYSVAKVRTPREAWIEVALDALADGGPDAVRVEQLATRLGVTKGGFYWHFADRNALLDAMLDQWELVLVDAVIAEVDRVGGDARARLGYLFALAKSATGIFGRELAIREWARRDEAVAVRLSRVDNRRMDYLRMLFREISADDDEAEARSVMAFCLFVGSYFIASRHPEKSRAELVELAIDRILLT